MTDVRQIRFAHRRSADQGRATPAHHPVVIVGAGPVGLVAALDLASKGHRSVVIDRKSNLSDGSRAICWAKRSLEIMDRLGVGQALVDTGITWKTGKVFFDTRQVYEFDLLPEDGHQRPAFINLQQYYFEHFCIEAARESGLIDIRWLEEVTGIEQTGDGVLLDIGTPDGSYRITADWVIAADGARSTLRRLLGLGFEGRVFQDQFLICDIKMPMQRPAERWFWFDPPFNRGQSALLHRQADDVWRLDFQVGNEADRDEEIKPENAARRVRAMLGEDIDFTLRVDQPLPVPVAAAGEVPPRSRDLRRRCRAPDVAVRRARRQQRRAGCRQPRLEARPGAARTGARASCSTATRPSACRPPTRTCAITARSTDFISPKGAMSRTFRDGVLALAETRAVRPAAGQFRAPVGRHLLCRARR